MITKKLAEEIVEQTMIRLNRNLNVMDTNGMILASGETERINSIHEGAEFVARTGNPLLITEENLENWYGTKPGMNMPVRFQEQIIGVIGVTGNPDEIQEIATLVQMTTEIMVHQALMTSRTEYIRKIKELIFEELKGKEPTSIIARERLNMLGFTEVSPFITLLMESDQFQPSPSGVIELLEEQFDQDSVLIGISEINEIFILIAGLNQYELKQKYLSIIKNMQKSNDIRIGIGHSVETLDDVHDSYQSAKNALQFGPQGQPVIFFEDVEFITLLKKNTTIETQVFSDRVLNGLDDSFRRTLTHYFENNLNNTLTANSLEIHRHTLTYRLKRVKEITKLDPMVFNEAILLKTALLLSNT